MWLRDRGQPLDSLPPDELCSRKTVLRGLFGLLNGKTPGNSAKLCCIVPIGKALTIQLGVRGRMVAGLAENPALLPRF